MATISTARAGNWSAGSTWAGGVVPGAGDTAQIGHTVTADVDIYVATILFPTGSATLTVPVARMIIADTAIRGEGLASGGILCNHTTGLVSITAGIIETIFNCLMVNAASTGAVEVNAPGGIHVLQSSGSGYAIQVGGVAAVTVNGNVRAQDLGTSGGAIRVAAAGASLTVNGDLLGFATSALLVTAVATITINGDVNALGSTAAIRPCMSVTAAATITVDGDCLGGAVAAAIVATAAAAIRVAGDISTTGVEKAVTTTGPLVFGGSLASSPVGELPFSAATVRVFPGHAFNWALVDTAGNHVLLSNLGDGLPDPLDVRQGVSYGGGLFAGLLAMPSPAQVSAGIPVDNTVGTAVLSGADVAVLVGAQLAAAMP